MARQNEQGHPSIYVYISLNDPLGLCGAVFDKAPVSIIFDVIGCTAFLFFFILANQ